MAVLGQCLSEQSRLRAAPHTSLSQPRETISRDVCAQRERNAFYGGPGPPARSSTRFGGSPHARSTCRHRNRPCSRKDRIRRPVARWPETSLALLGAASELEGTL